MNASNFLSSIFAAAVGAIVTVLATQYVQSQSKIPRIDVRHEVFQTSASELVDVTNSILALSTFKDLSEFLVPTEEVRHSRVSRVATDRIELRNRGRSYLDINIQINDAMNVAVDGESVTIVNDTLLVPLEPGGDAIVSLYFADVFLSTFRDDTDSRFIISIDGQKVNWPRREVDESSLAAGLMIFFVNNDFILFMFVLLVIMSAAAFILAIIMSNLPIRYKAGLLSADELLGYYRLAKEVRLHQPDKWNLLRRKILATRKSDSSA